MNEYNLVTENVTPLRRGRVARLIAYCDESLLAQPRMPARMAKVVLGMFVFFTVSEWLVFGRCAVGSLLLRCVGAGMALSIFWKSLWSSKRRRLFSLYVHTFIVVALPVQGLCSVFVASFDTWSMIECLFRLLLWTMVSELNIFFTINMLVVTLLGSGWFFSQHLCLKDTLVAICSTPETRMIPLAYMWTLFFCGWVIYLKREEHQQKMQLLTMAARRVSHVATNVLGMGKCYSSAIEYLLESATREETADGGAIITIPKKNYNALVLQLARLTHCHDIAQATVQAFLAPWRGEVQKTEEGVFSVGPCIDEAVAVATLCYSNRLTVQSSVKVPFDAWGSPILLTEILITLLDNIYIHSGANTEVSIWAEERQLFVEDNGPGIPLAHQPRIFDYFFTTRRSSLGMGLAYVKRGMHALGGTVNCSSSTEPGRSFTRFVLTFPPLPQA